MQLNKREKILKLNSKALDSTSPKSMNWLEQVIKLGKDKIEGKPDEVEEYLKTYFHKFYLLIEDNDLKGFCDYFVSGRELYIYNLVCKGSIWKMWQYCKKFMKDNNIESISFRRKKKEKRYGR